MKNVFLNAIIVTIYALKNNILNNILRRKNILSVLSTTLTIVSIRLRQPFSAYVVNNIETVLVCGDISKNVKI